MIFYKCKKCPQMVISLIKSPCTPCCCGEPMTALEAGVTDAALEKHVPVVTQDGNAVHVAVGEVEHLMLENHYIQFTAVETKEGFQVKKLEPGAKPQADYALSASDELVAAYEYCNLHGLWKK